MTTGEDLKKCQAFVIKLGYCVMSCLICSKENGNLFNEISAGDFALDFKEGAFCLIRDYWRRSNKVPSIHYKVSLLRHVVTDVLQREREHAIRMQTIRIRSHSF